MSVKLGSDMEQKIALLRALVDEVELVTCQDMAVRWGVTRAAVSEMFKRSEAPKPVLTKPRANYYALPEAEAFRSQRLLRRAHR